MEWIMARVAQNDITYYPNFVLMGDLNLDFDNPQTDRARIEKHIKTFNDSLPGANVNFPFLDIHPRQSEVFRTNARQSETFLVLPDFVSVDFCIKLSFNGVFWIKRYIEPEVPDEIITWSQDHLYCFCQ
jgi:hypothetical protein